MKEIILSLLLFCFSCHYSFAQKHYIVMETNYNYTHLSSIDTAWKPGVPYKKMVRIISEPFDFPSGFNINWSSEAGVQFLEYLMTKYKQEFNKMKGHLSYYTGVDWVYDPKKPGSVKQYQELTTNSRSGNHEFEIIVVKGFKFTPGKYPVIKNKGTTPLHQKALLLLSKGIDN